MRVILWPDVFIAPRTSDLLVFLWLGASLRHRIVVGDETDAAYLDWVGELDQPTRDDWEYTVRDGLVKGELSPSYYDIGVTGLGPSVWTGHSPTLTVADALDFLQRPYRVLVENGYSDAAFLLSVSDKETREFLEERISREWLEMEHCGGNAHLKRRVQEARRRPSTQMRCSALFDSDGYQPRKPSPTSRAIRDLCDPDVHHHQLQRRAIENYLPRAALEQWCKLRQARTREARKRQVEALFAMNEEQRAHYNMKEGFAGDAVNADKAGTLYSKLPAVARRLLDKGFGKDIAGLYQDGHVHHDDLERVNAVAMVQSFAREIVQRAR